MYSKFTHYLLLLFVFFISLTIVISCTSSNARKDEDIAIVTSKNSPSKDYIATVYIASGGGAAGYVYRLVNIRNRSEPFNSEKGIVFQMAGATELNIDWKDNHHFIIEYAKGASIYTQEKTWGDEGMVQVIYVER